ncbi:hypothetical protein Cadr_000015246 [Camelus dromedarius]|uniref:Uncharacterized protein n=1 Tax=Camelus dromedarius TaxID=9838 RepID=A0A5N4DLT2_CAMDR|nr:hypothetical protein Cadr_000015246 [Camelus dromedarius]
MKTSWDHPRRESGTGAESHARVDHTEEREGAQTWSLGRRDGVGGSCCEEEMTTGWSCSPRRFWEGKRAAQVRLLVSFQSSGMIRGLCRLWSFAPRGPHPVLGPLGWIHPAQVAHHWECRKAALLLVYAQTSLPLIQPAETLHPACWVVRGMHRGQPEGAQGQGKFPVGRAGRAVCPGWSQYFLGVSCSLSWLVLPECPRITAQA